MRNIFSKKFLNFNYFILNNFKLFLSWTGMHSIKKFYNLKKKSSWKQKYIVMPESLANKLLVFVHTKIN